MADAKATIEAGEDDEAAARREIAEELGLIIDGSLAPLGEICLAVGKIGIALVAEGDLERAPGVTTTTTLRGRRSAIEGVRVREIDTMQWFHLEDAWRCVLPSHQEFIARLARSLWRRWRV